MIKLILQFNTWQLTDNTEFFLQVQLLRFRGVRTGALKNSWYSGWSDLIPSHFKGSTVVNGSLSLQPILYNFYI